MRKRDFTIGLRLFRLTRYLVKPYLLLVMAPLP